MNNNQAVVTWNEGGTFTVFCRLFNGECYGPSQLLQVRVLKKPSLSLAVAENNNRCQGTTRTYTATGGNAGDAYTWSITPDATAGTISSSGNVATITWSKPGSHQVSVYATNNCFSSSDSPVTLNENIGSPAIALGPITGPDGACVLPTPARLNFSVNEVAGATYSWSSSPGPPGAVAVNPTASASAFDFFNAGNYTISVTANNGFCTGPASTKVVGIASPSGTPPATPTPSSGNPGKVCVGATATLAVNSLPGLTYFWAPGPGTEIIGSPNGPSVQVKFNTVGNGVVTVSARDYCNRVSLPRSLTVNVQPASASLTGFSGATEVCANQYTYSVNSSTQLNGVTWSVSGGGAVDNLAPGWVTNINWTTPGGPYTLTATGYNECGTNVASFSVPVTVKSGTRPASNTITGKTNPCVNSTESYSTVSQAGVSYLWKLNDNTLTGNTNTTTIVWSAAGNNNLSVTPYNAACQTNPTQLPVTVYPASVGGTLNTSHPQVCGTSSSIGLNLSGHTGTPSYRYRYRDFGGSWSSWITANNPQAVSSGSTKSREYEFKAIVTSGSCASVESTTATTFMYGTPNSSIPTAAPTSVCADQNVVLSVSTYKGDITWQMQYTDNGSTYTGWVDIAGATSPTLGYTVTNNGLTSRYYRFRTKVTNGNCTAFYSGFVSVTSRLKPVLTSTLTPASICSNSTFNYTPTSNISSSTFSWSRSVVAGISQAPSSGSGSVMEALTNTTASPVDVTYTYTTSFNGCYTTQNVVVTVNPQPVVSIDPPAPAICFGYEVDLTASGAASYTWSPATGLSATSGATVTASPAATTTYTVVGTLANGCSSSQVVTIVINPLPDVEVTPASPPAVCEGLNTSLTASGASTYTWSPAAGLSASTGETVTANPSTTTTYTVEGTDANGCVNSKAVVVTVNALPDVEIAPETSTICAGSNVTLTASGADNYSWSPATGLSAATGSIVTASPAVTTTYSVMGTDANGCSVSRNATVIVNNRPTATLNNQSAYVCYGTTINLSGNVTAAGSWTLTLSNDGGTVTGNGSGTWYKSVSPTTTTTYNIVSLVDANCAAWPSDLSGNVTIEVERLAASIVSPDTSICNGGSTILSGTVSAGGIWTITLSNGESFSSTGNIWSKAVSPSSTTTYTIVSLTTATCAAMTSDLSGATTITVNATPGASITPASSTTFCAGGSVRLQANTGAGLTYQWMLDGGNLGNANFRYYDARFAGDYSVRVTNSEGCSATSSPVIVNVLSAPQPYITQTYDLCSRATVRLAANGYVGASSLQWSTGSTSSYIWVTAGEYTVTAYYPNGCSRISEPFDVYPCSDPCDTNPTAIAGKTPSSGGRLYPCEPTLQSESTGLDIYPNQASKDVTIVRPQPSSDLRYVFINQFGEIVKSGVAKKGVQQHHVDVLDMPNGMYVIKLAGTEGSVTRKVIIAR
ncbi:MAG: T9SS type A sorting domain-containing protein [Bacteroidota bacterium]